MSNSEIIGSSAKFRAVLEAVEMVAPVNSAVLIQGETGTGKEVIAQAIHDSSTRRRQRLVAINCAAIPAALLESELFGHERGAFTGAVNQAVGRFELADHGTLFLDEIGELPLELQPKLLRVLQEQRFERLGSVRTQQVDVRIVAATNQNLQQLVRERKFRADLYYRLSVFPIMLPPLRERAEDIPLLLQHFVQHFAARYGRCIDCIPAKITDAAMNYHWPGNIRELQNFIERAVIRTRNTELDAPIEELMEACTPVAGPNRLVDANRAHILATLRQARGVIGGRNGAAARLGMPRTTLISMMRRLGISIDRAEESTLPAYSYAGTA
jgi:formate hydrogenlyase transcriptional activator